MLPAPFDEARPAPCIPHTVSNKAQPGTAPRTLSLTGAAGYPHLVIMAIKVIQ